MDNKDEKRWQTGQKETVFKLGGAACIVGGNIFPQYLQYFLCDIR